MTPTSHHFQTCREHHTDQMCSACFLNTTLVDGSQTDQAECDKYLCMPETYDHLSTCLNCIIANGNQRPLGYHTNSLMTAQATTGPLVLPAPIGGFLNVTVANGWLNNVTERCSSVGSPLNEVTSTLTATPTTTYVSAPRQQSSIWSGDRKRADATVVDRMPRHGRADRL